MKKILLAAACTIGLNGCGNLNPQTGAELRALAQTSVFLKESTYEVGRTASTVTQSWRTGAAKCLNRRTHTTTGGGNIGGVPMMAGALTIYSSQIQSTGSGGVELTVRMKTLGIDMTGATRENPTVIFAATVTPVAGGSRITDVMVTGAPFPVSNPINEGVRAWAEGTSSACPTMPR
ncbi:MAG: hypothetical protein GQ535_14180 [Rhodobacteraceae bacterium]|nr:hypothetical protein [Paracoccaceae bacterium]